MIRTMIRTIKGGEKVKNKDEMMGKLVKMRGRYEFKAMDDAPNEYKLSIYGTIGDWWDENTVDSISRELKGVEADTIHVHINSGGGNAFEGVAIGNFLKNHPAKIIVHVDGYAASAASVIAMAGDEIIMPSNTMLMIHQASTFMYGNADELVKVANDLRKIDTALRQSYKPRFVGTDEELEAMLKEETWLTADEAVALGLADEVVEEIEIVVDPDEDEDEDDEEPVDPIEDSVDVASIVAKYVGNDHESDEDTPQRTKKQNEYNEKAKRFNALLHI